MSYSVIIPSGNIGNLCTCVTALRREEPGEIIAVTDELPLEAFNSLNIKCWSLPGESPFIYSRNVNKGIRAIERDRDVILMNDDAVLITGTLAQLMDSALGINGIVSASVRGAVNNLAQHEVIPLYSHFPRENTVKVIETGYLAFVCVAIPRSVINRIGMLDERFTTYGGEDVDYCHRARIDDIPLAVYSGCLVDHGNLLPSTFRRFSVPDIEPGLQILRDKWAKIQNTPLPL